MLSYKCFHMKTALVFCWPQLQAAFVVFHFTSLYILSVASLNKSTASGDQAFEQLCLRNYGLSKAMVEKKKRQGYAKNPNMSSVTWGFIGKCPHIRKS